MKSPSRCSRLDWCSMVATRWTPFARGAWVSDTSGNQNAFPGSVRWSQPGRPNLASCAPTRLEFSEPARVTNSPPGCAALNGLSVQPAQSLLLWGRPPTKRTMGNGQGLGRRHSHRENPIGATTVVVNKDENRVPDFGLPRARDGRETAPITARWSLRLCSRSTNGRQNGPFRSRF